MIIYYMTDIISLISRYNFKECIIRPHPRFQKLSYRLANKIKKGGFFIKCYINEGSLEADSILGYYSSIMDDNDNNINRDVIISERATSSRYPNIPIRLLCGSAFGFVKKLKILSYDGEIFDLNLKT